MCTHEKVASASAGGVHEGDQLASDIYIYIYIYMRNGGAKPVSARLAWCRDECSCRRRTLQSARSKGVAPKGVARGVGGVGHVVRGDAEGAVEELREHCHPWMVVKRKLGASRDDKDAYRELGVAVDAMVANGSGRCWASIGWGDGEGLCCEPIHPERDPVHVIRRRALVNVLDERRLWRRAGAHRGVAMWAREAVLAERAEQRP